jgi:hypothetical protein
MMPEQSKSFPVILALAIVLVLGFLAANAVRWYCDDIFITLRYAKQYLGGNGFVYNAGERVEGYTHFLWLVIITALQRMGFDPVEAAVNLGIGSFLGTLVIFAFVSRRLSRGSAVLCIPMTSLALIANHECRIWASSGMETAFFAFLLSLAFFVYFFTGARRSYRLLASSLILVLAVMTRPDGLLIYGTAGVLLAGNALRSRRSVARAAIDAAVFGAPLVVVYLPYVLWKVSYYGSFFPNSYYAKSANLAYFSQGFYYLWLYFRAHPTSVLFLLSAVILVPAYFGGRRVGAAAAAAGDEPGSSGAAVPIAGDGPESGVSAAEEQRPESKVSAALTALCVVIVYLVIFVVRVGGGFMYARFIVPMLPFIYFLIEWSLRRLVPRRLDILAAALLLVPLIVIGIEGMLRNDLLLKREDGRSDVRIHRGILDERHYYTKDGLIERDRWLGEALRRFFAGLDATVLLRGQACLGYYGDFRRCIESAGLTNREIARLPLEERGRIGHEKSPSRGWLAEHGVDLVFARRPYLERGYRIAYFQIGDVALRAELITYDAALVKKLRERMGARFRFKPFEQALDEYIMRELPGRSAAELQKDYEEFREFYFNHNDDPEREKIFIDAL